MNVPNLRFIYAKFIKLSIIYMSRVRVECKQ